MRRSRKYQREVTPLNTHRLMGYTRYEIGADGLEYKVHSIPSAKKQYVCPGCNGIISVGVAHVVAWTEESLFGPLAGARERRHWHTGCWNARGRRR
ncbi:ATP/GTP-binding protein [Arcanobacterium bovis]|uniref:ATP/GTP-binding protein n=1 Tax=Arcanobacterium bovis TaxID=2529275 RepID=A0A4Q9V1C8_9ACTO|nr:ATP/GTP-binding protein [Arcanobacterium bovis]TBW21577.1 ATP/GTP-binding protein [Arcanobacterium bovis]